MPSARRAGGRHRIGKTRVRGARDDWIDSSDIATRSLLGFYPPSFGHPSATLMNFIAGALRPMSFDCGSSVPIVTRLALAHSQVTASEALDVGKCTAGIVEVVLFAFHSLSSIQVDLEMGNDRENWSRVSSSWFTRLGFTRFRFRGIPSKYIRLYYRATGDPGGIGILMTTINGSVN